MKRRIWTLVPLVLLAIGLVGGRPRGAAAQPPFVDPENLDTPHDIDSAEAFATNNSGVVVGDGAGAGSLPRPVVWGPAGVQTLPSLGGDAGTAFDVNASGVVVGRSENSAGAVQGFRWRSGPLAPLRSLVNGARSEALRVSDDGTAVGYSATAAAPGSPEHAVRWVGDRVEDLGTLGGASSRASAIDAAGRIGGWSEDERGRVRPFLWADGRMRDLGTLDGYAAGRVLRMNAGGDAVGWSETGAGVDDNRRAVLYTSGNLVDLGVPTGHESSQAYGLNNGGIVVGTATDAFGRPHAFAWRDGRIVNLNALLDPQSDWVLQTAFDVTDSGQVVGSGTLAGLRRAYRLQLPASLGGAAAASDASSVSTTPLPSAAGSADATPTQPTDADRGSTGPKALPSTGGGADGGPFGDAALLLAALVLGALGALGAAAEGRRGTPFQSEAR